AREPGAAGFARLDARRARRAGFHVAAHRRHRDLVDRVEVGIEERAVVAFGVVDPLEDHLRLAANAERVVAGLLALVAAADVVALHAHAGRLRQIAPQIGRARHAPEALAAE